MKSVKKGKLLCVFSFGTETVVA